MRELNKLTKELISEGYTAEHFPKYVYLTKSFHKDDPFYNFDGGFQYYYWYSAERIYETNCGLLCKGNFAHSGLTWYGKEYRHENDNPTIRCPKLCADCKLRDEPFCSNGDGVLLFMCPVHKTDRAYTYEGSCEQLLKLKEAEIEREKENFILKQQGKICKEHMRYDQKTQEWSYKWNPYICATGFCRGKHGEGCPIFGELGEKGNVYFDMEYEGRDYTKDGTLFEGERFRITIKDIQVFNKPIPLKIAEAYARLNQDDIKRFARYNRAFFDSLTMYKADIGAIDLSYKVTNIRAVKKLVRDFEQDLEDIANGITVIHEFDEQRAKKAAKKERKDKAKEKATAALERKIMREGFDDLSYSEQRRCEKLLGQERIDRLLDDRKVAEEEKMKAPQQMTLFDFGI